MAKVIKYIQLAPKEDGIDKTIDDINKFMGMSIGCPDYRMLADSPEDADANVKATGYHGPHGGYVKVTFEDVEE